MKSRKIFTILISVVTIIFSGCYYDIEEELYPSNSGQSPCDTIVPTYSLTIQPIVSSSCASQGCHIANGQSPDLSDYNNLKSNIEIVKVRAIEQKSMPPSGPLSACDLTVLEKWINNGALNN